VGRFVRLWACVSLVAAQLFLVSSAAAQTQPDVVPDTPLGHQLTWVMETLNSNASGLTEEMVTETFGSQFLKGVPPKYLIENLKQWAALGAPLTVLTFERKGADQYGVAAVKSRDGSQVAITIAVEPKAPHRIALLLIQPIPDQAVEIPTGAFSGIPLESWDEFDETWKSSAEKTSFLAAELTDDGCNPVHAINPDGELAIGSISDLFILGALVVRIENGASWDDQLAIHDEWKTRPPGSMQEEAAGKQFSLEQYATQMIQSQDRTAASHLLNFLGRQQVESVQLDMGLVHPELNQPFLSPQEFLTLKASASEVLVHSYIVGSADERRDLLKSEVPSVFVDDMDVAAMTAPKNVDSIGWFASMSDLCNAMHFLHEAGQKPGMGPLATILLDNNGPFIGTPEWPRGGIVGAIEEPGVSGSIWLVQRGDGRWFVIAGVFNDSTHSLSSTPVGAEFFPALRLLSNAS
jgi:hypothetical protein